MHINTLGPFIGNYKMTDDHHEDFLTTVYVSPFSTSVKEDRFLPMEHKTAKSSIYIHGRVGCSVMYVPDNRLVLVNLYRLNNQKPVDEDSLHEYKVTSAWAVNNVMWETDKDDLVPLLASCCSVLLPLYMSTVSELIYTVERQLRND